VAYFQLGGSSYINLLPDILPIVENAGYDIEIVDLRTYSTNFDFSPVDTDSYTDRTWPAGHPHEGQPIKLRDYQVQVINDFLANPQCLQEIATGAGKTLITAVLSHKCEPYGRTIVIVPNKSLVTQTEADYRNMRLDVGVYFGDRKEYGRQHTICTWQSLTNLLKATKESEAEVPIGEFLEGVVCVIVDEAHGAKADALKSILTGVMAHLPIRWGLTGTIPKEDFEFYALRCSLGEVVSRISARELQDRGVLANCHVKIRQMVEYGEYKTYQSEQKYLLDNEDRMRYIASEIERISQDGNTLVLIDRVGPGRALTAMIPGAVFVNGGTKASVRKEHYDEVATADGKVIVATYGVAAVGINIPRIFNLILIEPGKSFVRVIQSIGRGVRRAQDKDFVQIWDFTSTCKFSKRHLTKRKQFYRDAAYPFTIEKVEWQ
jgi:superfamily II DNA or RNA helicase